MKRVLAVLNIGGKSMHAKSRASFEAACERWGCDYKEFTKPIEPGVHHYWQKAFVIEQLQQYDQVLQLDADMLINIEAPSPMLLVPSESLGVVSCRQHYWPSLIRTRNNCILEWSRRTGLKPTRDARHLNGGLLIYSPKAHRRLFEEWRSLGRRSSFGSTHLPEQAVLSLLIARNKWKGVTWLPHTFNKTNIWRDTQREMSSMTSYIYHFSGGNSRTKARLIDGTHWKSPIYRRETEARTAAILNRIPKAADSLKGVEVGVLAARNASTLLREREGLSLTLVDQWREPDPGGTYAASGDGQTFLVNEDWAVVLQEAIYNLMPFHGRYQIVQSDSVAASVLVRDQSLDFAFIDGDHSKTGCLADIDAWLPKIKNGGWIGGHDYKARLGGKWGVREAVLERFSEARVQTGRGDTWFVYV